MNVWGKGGNVHFARRKINRFVTSAEKTTQMNQIEILESSRAFHPYQPCEILFLWLPFSLKTSTELKTPGHGIVWLLKGNSISSMFLKKLLFCMTSIIYRTCGSITYCRSFLEKCCHDLKIVAMHFENF